MIRPTGRALLRLARPYRWVEVLNSQRNLLISQTALARATYVNLSSRLRLAMIAGAHNEDLMRETNASLTLR